MAQGVYPVTRDPRRPDTYMFSFRDRQGRRHFRKGFDTKKAAEAARHQLEQELRDNTYVAPKDIPTFGTIADAWLSSKSTHRPSSQSQWKVHIDHLFNPGLGFNLRTTKINEVDVQAIEKVRNELRKEALSHDRQQNSHHYCGYLQTWKTCLSRADPIRDMFVCSAPKTFAHLSDTSTKAKTTSAVSP